MAGKVLSIGHHAALWLERPARLGPSHEAAGHAVRAKTARLKERRLAKEAADKKDKIKQDTKSK